MVSIRKVDVLFVCLHGSAKSVIAAAHFRRLAALRGLVIECGSAGLEPDEFIPPHVVTGLAADGLEAGHASPQQVTRDAMEAAACVVSFGCDLSALAPHAQLRVWEDIPAVSDGYVNSRAAITERLSLLIDEVASDLRSRPSVTTSHYNPWLAGRLWIAYIATESAIRHTPATLVAQSEKHDHAVPSPPAFATRCCRRGGDVDRHP